MKSLISPREPIYFFLCLGISLLVYAGLVLTAFTSIESFAVFAFYIVLGVFFSMLVQGLFIGHIRGNAIRVSGAQFPEVYKAVQDMAQRMELAPSPSVYILQAGGLLNAFATRFIGRNFVVVYSDVLELALERGEQELNFVLCHELAHIKRKHLIWRMLLWPAMFFPFLATAYSRACEYTCDRFGAHYVPDGAVSGVVVLAAGKRLYRNVNVQELLQQRRNDGGFWVWFAELLSTHPTLMKRVAAVEALAGTQAPSSHQSMTATASQI